MPKTKTRIWDPAEHLITEEDMAAYLEAALQEGDSVLIAAALGDIARAKGTSHSTLSNGAVAQPTPAEKATVKLLLEHLKNSHGFWQQQEPPGGPNGQ